MTEQQDDTEQPNLHRRIRSKRGVGFVYKIVITIVGIAVVLAGIAMLVFPGPGWAAIILGLVILASEYVWAQKLLDPIKRLAEAAAERALDPKRRRQNLILVAVGVVIAALLLYAYYLRYGFTIEPLPLL